MNLEVEPGKYLVAVSGGVDSVVLLDLLQAIHGVECVVAHFDHGIRPNSKDDARFVQELAHAYGCEFITKRVELGPQTSEALARTARYQFLHHAAEQQDAIAVVTAHHEDDVLETVIFNILRGTGRRGLASLRSTKKLQRPLLSYSKQQLLAYAAERNLHWCEDDTNNDERYTRNYIRHRLLTRFGAESRQQLLEHIQSTALVNDQLDALLSELIKGRQDGLERRWFSNLAHKEAREVLAYWLRINGFKEYDAHGLERLTVQLKVRSLGTVLDVKHGAKLHVEKKYITFKI